ncbi:MAG: DinB family protein [Candidatus Rokubacteria bacterium]|nr:DinB family protein [Candidatus Rokubacteria bacterium]
MYQPIELARFALLEFERGLEGLTDNEARARLTKPDGTQMNAISWVIGHVAQHWLGVRGLATGEPRTSGLRRFASGSADPTPPPLAETLTLLQDAKASIDWIANADEALLATSHGEILKSRLNPVLVSLGLHEENLGTALVRAILHTWFHTGEINAIRQMLGHPEIFFVGRLVGNLEWRSVPKDA